MYQIQILQPIAKSSVSVITHEHIQLLIQTLIMGTLTLMALCYSKESQWMMILRIELLVAFQTWMKTTQSRNPHLQWVGDL